MQTTMYWLDVDGDRVGLDVSINDVPANHLLKTHGIKLPINEYLTRGRNTVSVSRGLWPSNVADTQAAATHIELVAKTFRDGKPIGEQVVLFDLTIDVPLAAPGQIFAAGEFVVDGPGSLPDLAAFEPVDDAQRQLVLGMLDWLAAAFRSGDQAALQTAMAPYIDAYEKAYPAQPRGAMAGSFARMLNEFAREERRVVYARSAVRLALCGGGKLVECLSGEGAAIRLLNPGSMDYNFWCVAGVRNGKAEIVR